MYVRDHARPEFHKALGIDPTDYDYRVFRITNDISRQVFPVVLDINNPKFRTGLERLRVINEKLADVQVNRGLVGWIQRATLGTDAAAHVCKTFPSACPWPIRIPESSHMEPAW